jgi:exopolyphosphatase/guanosine-5'-triphosphate,3'-diphosphate pyrophosphatase
MSTPGRLAIIEVGSKGIRLLVAEPRDPPEGMEVLRSLGDRGNLGEGLEHNQGRIQRKHIERNLGLVHKFLRIAEPFRPDRMALVGTEVFRRATNVGEFRAGLPRELALRVLQPEEEAVGSFLAACWGFRHTLPAGGNLVLVDLGGGSTEVIAGVQGAPPCPRATVSMRSLGTLRLAEVWQRSPDPTRREEQLRPHIEAELARNEEALTRLRPSVGAAGPLQIAGVGSTVTDSAWLLKHNSRRKFRSDEVHGLSTGVADLEGLRRNLLAALHGGARGRELLDDMGIEDAEGHQLGLAVLLPLLRRLDAPAITACGYGLRFGLAYALLNDIPLALNPAPKGTLPENEGRV